MRAAPDSFLTLSLASLLGTSLAGLAIAEESVPASGEAVLRAEPIRVDDSRIRPAEVYQDTPVETEVITAEEIEQLPAIDAIDLLDAIPGIRIQARVQGQRGAVSIDGLPPDYTELLVDGQRYSGENQEAQDLGDLLVANLERIDLLRGPQALKYTARAGGGVINFVTRDAPKDGVAVTGLVALGDQGRRAAEASVAYGTEKFGGTLIVDFNEIEGFDDPFPDSGDARDGLPSPFGKGSLYRTTDVYSTGVARPSDRLELRARFGYRLRDDALATDGEPVSSRAEAERFLANVSARFEATDWATLYGRLTFYHRTFESTTGREVEILDQSERIELGSEFYFEWGDTSHLVTVGADLLGNMIDVDEGPVPPTIDNPDLVLEDIQRRYGQLGLFVVSESEIFDWLSIEGGLRYEMNDQFKPELLPQAAVLFTPWRWDAERALKLRISAGRAARYPALREIYQSPAPQLGGSYFLAGSRDIQHETLWAVRASVEANPVRWFSGTLSGFYNEVDDRIRSSFQGRTIQVGVSDPIPPNPFLCGLGELEFCAEQIVPLLSNVFESDNLDDLQTWGIEARAELRPWKWFELQLGYTWLQTKLVDSNILADELPNSPNHIVNARLVLEEPRFGTKLTTRASWRDRALTETSGTGLVSFVTGIESRDSFDVDMRLLQPLERWVGFPLAFFADANNLTDNRVVDSNQVRGRSFLAGLQGRWN